LFFLITVRVCLFLNLYEGSPRQAHLGCSLLQSTEKLSGGGIRECAEPPPGLCAVSATRPRDTSMIHDHTSRVTPTMVTPRFVRRIDAVLIRELLNERCLLLLSHLARRQVDDLVVVVLEGGAVSKRDARDAEGLEPIVDARLVCGRHRARGLVEQHQRWQVHEDARA